MKAATWLRLAVPVLLVVSTSLLAGPPEKAAGKARAATPIKVMTQNLYIGTDILALAEAESVCGLLRAASDALDELEQNDYRQRIEALAALILEHSPHVLGVQEAVTVSYADFFGIEYQFEDYLAALIEALDGQYYLVGTRSSAELEVPANRVGSCDEDNPFSAVDVRATVVDQDAFLCRADIECEPAGEMNFNVNTVVSTPAGDVAVERGWVAVRARVKGREFQLFNTHLEVNSNALLRTVQYAQSLELVTFLNSLKTNGLPQVVLGDFNSDENAGFPECAELDFCQSSYQVMQNAGFVDTWTQRGGKPVPGYTCCQDADLRNPETGLLERIDQVWVRAAPGRRNSTRVRGVQARVVGDKPGDLTVPDGLWPSDHGGVVTRMWISHPK